jgi:hypothetical protein
VAVDHHFHYSLHPSSAVKLAVVLEAVSVRPSLEFLRPRQKKLGNPDPASSSTALAEIFLQLPASTLYEKVQWGQVLHAVFEGYLVQPIVLHPNLRFSTFPLLSPQGSKTGSAEHQQKRLLPANYPVFSPFGIPAHHAATTPEVFLH